MYEFTQVNYFISFSNRWSSESRIMFGQVLGNEENSCPRLWNPHHCQADVSRPTFCIRHVYGWSRWRGLPVCVDKRHQSQTLAHRHFGHSGGSIIQLLLGFEVNTVLGIIQSFNRFVVSMHGYKCTTFKFFD